MFPLHKKGARDQVENFSMCSRVLGRVIAKRVRRWAKKLELLENKAGFSKGRSIADLMQVHGENPGGYCVEQAPSK